MHNRLLARAWPPARPASDEDVGSGWRHAEGLAAVLLPGPSCADVPQESPGRPASGGRRACTDRMAEGPIRRIGRRPSHGPSPWQPPFIGRGSHRHARSRCRITGRPGHDARPGLPRPTPRGDGRCRGRIARRGAPDAAAQGVAHELAGRPAQEGRPLGVLLRRGQGAVPPGRGDVRPGLPGRARQQRPGPGGQGAPPAVRAAPRGGPPLPQGGRGRHAAPPPQHRPDHRRGPAG